MTKLLDPRSVCFSCTSLKNGKCKERHPFEWVEEYNQKTPWFIEWCADKKEND